MCGDIAEGAILIRFNMFFFLYCLNSLYPLGGICKQIGNHFVVDPTLEEESCSSSGILVAVAGNREIMAVRKIGSGSLHSESLASMLKVLLIFFFLLSFHNKK